MLGCSEEDQGVQVTGGNGHAVPSPYMPGRAGWSQSFWGHSEGAHEEIVSEGTEVELFPWPRRADPDQQTEGTGMQISGGLNDFQRELLNS